MPFNSKDIVADIEKLPFILKFPITHQ